MENIESGLLSRVLIREISSEEFDKKPYINNVLKKTFCKSLDELFETPDIYAKEILAGVFNEYCQYSKMFKKITLRLNKDLGPCTLENVDDYSKGFYGSLRQKYRSYVFTNNLMPSNLKQEHQEFWLEQGWKHFLNQ